MKVLKTAGWYIYAFLATIVTLGIFIRFHLVTVRKRRLGGVRAGTFGCTQVYRDSEFLILSTWHGKKRFPANRIAYAETGPLKVKLQSNGGKTVALGTWQTRSVADYINRQVNRSAEPEHRVPAPRHGQAEGIHAVPEPSAEETTFNQRSG